MTATPSTYPAALTGDHAIDAITTGYSWILDSSRTLNWTLSDGYLGEYWNNPGAAVTYIDEALQTIEYYANIHFNYLGYYQDPSQAASAGSHLNYSLSSSWAFFSRASIWAIGFFPNASYNWTQYSGAPGDFYLNVNSQANYLPSYAPGSAGFALILHETGHMLGLKHTHDDGGTGHPTLTDLGFASLDQDWVSVMSYHDEYQWNYLSWEPFTPMVLDVLGLMAMYGPNTTTNAGNSYTELGNYNGYSTLWDASGTDTLSVSYASEGWFVALALTANPTLGIDIGMAAPGSGISSSQPTSLWWLLGTHENIIGSSYADVLAGNAGANLISGAGGNDTLSGGAGNDTLVGGAGVDTIAFSGNRSAYSIAQTATGYSLGSGAEGTDTVSTVEYFQFADQTVAVSSLVFDTTAPTVASFSPADEAASVAIDSNIAITFSEAIQRGSGYIYLKTAAGTTVETYAAATSTNLSVSGRTLTIDPTANLGYGTAYRIELAGDSVRDSAGNGYAGSTAYNFTTIGGLLLYGTSGSDTLNGGAGNDTIYGYAGDDYFDWDVSPGADVFYGGTGNDNFAFDSVSDSAVEYPGEGTDTIWVRQDYSIANLPHIENLASFAGTGVSLTGNSGSNLLYGFTGNDTIIGGGGNDFLDGDGGLDAAVFGNGRSAYALCLRADGSVEIDGADGTDRLAGIEQLQFGDGTVSLREALPEPQLDCERHYAKVQSYFLGLLGRPATTEEAGHFTAVLRANQSRIWWYDASQTTTDGSLMSYLMAQGEYATLAAGTSTQIVGSIFQRLTGQPAPDALIEHYAGRLNAGTLQVQGVTNKLLGELYLSPRGNGTLGTVTDFADNRGYLDGAAYRGYLDNLDAIDGIDIANLDSGGNLVGLVGVT